MAKRVISTQMQEEDIKIETSLRPQTLEDYIGQEKIKDSMKVYIDAAKARGEDIAPLLAEVDNMGEQLNEAKTQLDAVLAEINQIALSIPNIPADEVGIFCLLTRSIV